MVLGQWFVVFGRIVVPSSSVSIGVCLDPEDDGTSHTATQCRIPKDLNLPTSTFVPWILLQHTLYPSVRGECVVIQLLIVTALHCCVLLTVSLHVSV
jgi:hypothetical protein